MKLAVYLFRKNMAIDKLDIFSKVLSFKKPRKNGCDQCMVADTRSLEVLASCTIP